MRVFVYPEPVELMGTDTQTGKRKLLQYDNDLFHREYVWGDPVWRKGNNIEVRERCIAALEGKKPGETVKMTDEDFEIYKPVVTMEGQTVRNPELSIPLGRLMRPVLLATSEPKETSESSE